MKTLKLICCFLFAALIGHCQIIKPEYTAIVTKIYDGDTPTLDIDLGYDLVLKGVGVRLDSVNTNEVSANATIRHLSKRNRKAHTTKGKMVRDSVRALIAIGSKVIWRPVLSLSGRFKRGKYGRPIGSLYFWYRNDWISLSRLLIDRGWAEFKIY